MKLYTVALAPNPTKVMLYIAERDTLGPPLPIEQITVNTLKGRHREPEHLARNPFGTLPVLEYQDGAFLRESLTIINYLAEKFPEGALLTGSPEARAQARDLERIIEFKIANPIAEYVHVKASPVGYPPNPERAAAIEDALQKPLDFLEGLLGDARPFLGGEAVSVADFTLAAAFQFLRFIKVDLIGERPLLRAWDARYRARDAVQSVLKW
ncbi:MAG: glutathione S-transferase family protein [Henriciella sp.]|nr:glutathione S-transferase family protein [Henriciella sp.]